MHPAVFHNTWFRTATMVATVALAGVTIAATTGGNAGNGVNGSGDDCPHQGIKTVPSQIKYGPMKECGTGLVVSTGGLSVHSPKLSCPTFAVYEPPHHAPTPKHGFQTALGGRSPILVFTFQCNMRWFLFLPIGTECQATNSKNAGSIQNYTEFACGGRNQREPGTGSGSGRHGKIGGK